MSLTRVIVDNRFYGEEDIDPDYEKFVARQILFLVPTCKRCGHTICPCCGNACDTLIRDEDDPEDFTTCPCMSEGCDLGGLEVIEVGPVYGMDLPNWETEP